MSDQLRQALHTMQDIAEREHAAPVTYLHDPETGKAFGALVQLDVVAKIEGWDPVKYCRLKRDSFVGLSGSNSYGFSPLGQTSPVFHYSSSIGVSVGRVATSLADEDGL